MEKRMRYAILVMVILMMVSCTGIAFAYPNYYTLQISMVNQQPDPVEPGQYVDVRFRIENIGNTAADNVSLELVPEYPFKLAPGDSAIQDIGTINSREVDEKSTVVKYRLIVDENAIDGPNELKLRYRVKGSDPTELDPFMINIRSPEAIISVDQVKLVPEMVSPGEKATLSIKIRNNADSILKDIKVKLNLDSVPLAPVDSTNELVVKALNAGETADLTFTVAAEPTASSSLYKVPISINYKDKLGNLFSKNETFGIVIGNTPDLAVSLRSSDLVTGKSKGKVTVQFVNKGVTGIKFLYVILGQSNDFKIIGPDRAYIGKIDSDDYETADFSIYAVSDKDISLPIHVEYRDANNNLFTRQENVIVPIYSSSEAKQLGLVTNGGLIGPLITLIIVICGIVAYVIYRRRKKQKKG